MHDHAARRAGPDYVWLLALRLGLALGTGAVGRILVGGKAPFADQLGAVGVDEDSEGRLKLLQAPRKTVSAETTERLATVRDRPELTMAFPRTRSWPLPSAAKLKTAVGAITTTNDPIWFRGAASYNSLKKGLTPLLDRISAKPYFGRAISTPKARLPEMLAVLAPSGRPDGYIPDRLSTANQI
jgi:hypothetical protein